MRRARIASGETTRSAHTVPGRLADNAEARRSPDDTAEEVQNASGNTGRGPRSVSDAMVDIVKSFTEVKLRAALTGSVTEQTATPGADDGAGDSDGAHRGFTSFRDSNHLPGKEPVTTRSIRGSGRIGQAQIEQLRKLLKEPRACANEAFYLRGMPPVEACAARTRVNGVTDLVGARGGESAVTGLRPQAGRVRDLLPSNSRVRVTLSPHRLPIVCPKTN